MRYVKFSVERTAPQYEVSKKNFEEQTKKLSPWQLKDEYTNEERYYAICPKCDNPVRLIGLYKATNRQPFASHTGKTIKGGLPILPPHNQKRYEYCPLSKKSKRIDPDEHLYAPEKIHIELYNIMRENFDKLVYFIENMLEIECSTNFWREALTMYVNSKGWLFRWISLENMPWAFCYMAMCQKKLYGQKIKIGGYLHKAIEGKCEQDAFSKNTGKYVRITNQGSTYLPSITLRFIGYDYSIDSDGYLVEIMRVCLDYANEEILSKQMTLDQQQFRNLLRYEMRYNIEKWKRLREVGHEMMPPLSVDGID